MRELPFYSDCVSWDRAQLAALMHIVDEGEEVGRSWFMRNVARESVEPFADLTEPRWTHRGTVYFRLSGWPVFWFTNSCIEYVFADRATIARLTEHARA